MRKLSLISALILCLALCGCAPKSNVDQEFLSGVQSSFSEQTTSATSLPAQDPENEAEFSFSPSDMLDEQGHYKDVKALDYVTLCEYKGIKVPSDVHTPSEDAVQKQIDGLLDNLAQPEHIMDAAVQDGDTVNIDYVGSIDGVEFEGGNTKGNGTSVTIGVTSYIDDFLEQLIGHKPGETINVEVTFPENYGKENLNGKDAVFVTTINYIEGEMITPELTDALVAENFAHMEWATVEDMREGIREDLRDIQTSNFLQKYIVENSKITEIPESLITFQENTALDRYNTYAQYYGVSLDEFIVQASDFDSRQALLDSMSDDFKESAKYYLVIQAIAEQENITLTDDKIISYFSEGDSADFSAYADEYGMPYLAYAVLNSLVMETVRDAAVLE